MKFLTTFAVVSLLALVFSVGLNSGNKALAWKVGHESTAVCNAQTATIDWTFTNKEPNEDRWEIDLVVKDLQSGVQTTKQTVTPGQTVSGSIDTGEGEIESGKVAFAMTWTDGRSGVDTRTSEYSAIKCVEDPVCEWDPSLTPEDPNCKEPEVCEFDDQLPADDPNCKAPEVCEFDENLSPDDPNCKEEEVLGEIDPPAPVLPNTGAASIAMSALSVGALAAGVDAYVRSRQQA